MRAITPKPRRRLAAALAACACLGVGSAVADSTDDAVRKANEMAYSSAMKCLVADGLLAGRYRDAGDATRQRAYEASARQSFDIAEKLGEALGYSENRINQDFSLAHTEELPTLVSDAAHLRRLTASCKALGLM